MLISLVIPVFNECDSLRPLWDEITATAREHSLDIEAIFVDDGSRDGSWDKIAELAASDHRVQGIRFAETSARLPRSQPVRGGPRPTRLHARCRFAGRSKEFPRFIAEIEKGKDVVSGWKQTRLDPWHKVWPSKVFNFPGGLDDRRSSARSQLRLQVLSPRGLVGDPAVRRNAPICSRAGPRSRLCGRRDPGAHHRPRQHGVSKYGFERFVKGFSTSLRFDSDGLQSAAAAPFGSFGLLAFAIGSIGLTYLTGTWICAQIFPEWNLDPLHKRPAVLYSVAALLLGAQLLSMGILAELIAAQTGNRSHQYSIRERTQPNAPQTE